MVLHKVHKAFACLAYILLRERTTSPRCEKEDLLSYYFPHFSDHIRTVKRNEKFPLWSAYHGHRTGYALEWDHPHSPKSTFLCLGQDDDDDGDCELPFLLATQAPLDERRRALKRDGLNRKFKQLDWLVMKLPLP